MATLPQSAGVEGMLVHEEAVEPLLDTAFGYDNDLKKLPTDYDPLVEMRFREP
jgi:hypothetical protein